MAEILRVCSGNETMPGPSRALLVDKALQIQQRLEFMNSPFTPDHLSKLKPRQAVFTATQAKTKPKLRVKAQETCASIYMNFGNQQARMLNVDVSSFSIKDLSERGSQGMFRSQARAGSSGHAACLQKPEAERWKSFKSTAAPIIPTKKKGARSRF